MLQEDGQLLRGTRKNGQSPARRACLSWASRVLTRLGGRGKRHKHLPA